MVGYFERTIEFTGRPATGLGELESIDELLRPLGHVALEASQLGEPLETASSLAISHDTPAGAGRIVLDLLQQLTAFEAHPQTRITLSSSFEQPKHLLRELYEKDDEVGWEVALALGIARFGQPIRAITARYRQRRDIKLSDEPKLVAVHL